MADIDPALLQGAAESAGAGGNTPADPQAPSDGPDDQSETSGGGDSKPLSSIQIDPAEDGGAVVTHNPKVPERVGKMDHEATRPKKHVVTDHKELMKHLDRHTKRLTP